MVLQVLLLLYYYYYSNYYHHFSNTTNTIFTTTTTNGNFTTLTATTTTSCYESSIFLFHLALIVGFERTHYSVNESTGMLEICVVVSYPPIIQTLNESIVVLYNTVEGSAGNFHSCYNI